MNTDKELFLAQLGKKIKGARLRKNLTQQELSDLVGTSKSMISSYESGKNDPAQSTVIKLSDALGVSPEWLMGYEPQTNDKRPTNTTPVTSTVNIPLLGKIACGDPVTALENVDEYIPRPTDNLPTGGLYYLTATGDSMTPVIPDGSLVLCRAQEDVENGEIAAVLLNDMEEATLKKIRKFETSWVLEPLNREYEPIVINGENTCRIIGKVLEVTVKLGG